MALWEKYTTEPRLELFARMLLLCSLRLPGKRCDCLTFRNCRLRCRSGACALGRHILKIAPEVSRWWNICLACFWLGWGCRLGARGSRVERCKEFAVPGRKGQIARSAAKLHKLTVQLHNVLADQLNNAAAQPL